MAGPEPDERFERLVREHARLMRSAIRRVCGRRHGALAPDVEQEVYLALWRRLRNPRRIDHPASYVYKVALTTALAIVRRIERELRLAVAEERAPREAAPLVGGLTAAERAVVLGETLATLEPDEARALRAYLAGFSHGEVAELYGWTESVARHRIYRTLERLRERARAREGESDE
ncbi:MAG: sigma-70 family RNA polymerase sigma factor [Thermoanaerobaculia bacterium]|nr:sigma-70 family RNA polymerase sigma factor [Thermoanaerobaculia bacterium]